MGKTEQTEQTEQIEHMTTDKTIHYHSRGIMTAKLMIKYEKEPGGEPNEIMLRHIDAVMEYFNGTFSAAADIAYERAGYRYKPYTLTAVYTRDAIKGKGGRYAPLRVAISVSRSGCILASRTDLIHMNKTGGGILFGYASSDKDAAQN